jgi:hypothetical protein
MELGMKFPTSVLGSHEQISSTSYGAGHGSRAVWGIYSLRLFGSRDRGFESHSGNGCFVCVCAFFCVCVVLCLGRGLATSWSPLQGVLPSVNDQESEKSALYSKVGATGEETSYDVPFLLFCMKISAYTTKFCVDTFAYSSLGALDSQK